MDMIEATPTGELAESKAAAGEISAGKAEEGSSGADKPGSAVDEGCSESGEHVKSNDEFRDYTSNLQTEVVRNHYKMMREGQCLGFVQRMVDKWGKFDKASLTIREAFELLEGYVDSSDPDIVLSNTAHALQTAEAMREAGEPEWMVLTGLLHDMGKIMFHWGDPADGQQGTLTGPQWALGGDTWVVGAPIPDSVVFPEFNELNPDHGKYTGTGIYEKGCGLKNLQFAFGHDEYMYMMLKHNKATLPDEAFAMIRYHSCYPWHNENEYADLMEPSDEKMKEWVKRFNNYDLYTKSPTVPDVDAVWPYYQGLIDKFCPGKLQW